MTQAAASTNPGELLYTARIRAGLTIAALAERSGVDSATISRLETGRSRRLYARTAWALAEATGLDATELCRSPRPAPAAGVPRLLRIYEVAATLGISTESVYDLIAVGRIATVDVGSGHRSHTRVSEASLAAFIERQTTASRGH